MLHLLEEEVKTMGKQKTEMESMEEVQDELSGIEARLRALSCLWATSSDKLGFDSDERWGMELILSDIASRLRPVVDALNLDESER